MTNPVAIFLEVRSFPYAIDMAHDADGLVRLREGDCLAKSDLLIRRMSEIGLVVRPVRWLYELPDVVPEVRTLPRRLDLHRAIQIEMNSEWILIDATHDPALAAGGLVVAEWDGPSPTSPAYPPLGPIMVEGRDDLEIDAALAATQAWVEACPPHLLAEWRSAYSNWLAEVRLQSE